MEGKIYSSNSGKYIVKDVLGKMHILNAAGVFRHKKISPIVGDIIEFDKSGVIRVIYDRKNELIRPKVSNIDYVMIIMSAYEPEFSTYLVDKYMAIIESKNITPILCITKVDIKNCDSYIKEYEKMGYLTIKIDYTNNKYKEKIKSIFKHNTIVLMGQSGVGKTTLLNKITNNSYKTQEISKSLNRGKHTTRIVQIVPFWEGEIIDTPGFSSLNLDIEPNELAYSYKQFKEIAKLCKFKTCLHYNEPENYCNVKINVNNGNIPLFRYQNYLKLLKEIKNE